MAYPLFLFMYMRIGNNGEEFVGSQTAEKTIWIRKNGALRDFS